MVVKGGFIAWSAMGDPHASIPTPQPVLYRPMFGSFGLATASTSITFLQIGKKQMIPNNATPLIEVDPETYEVRVDGQLITCEPAKILPLAQRYFLF